MGLADLFPPALRWTVAESWEVVHYGDKLDKEERKAFWSRALVAHGPDGVDVPVLRLVQADLHLASDHMMETAFALLDDDSGGKYGTTSIGFGARRHDVMVPSEDGWRVAGELVRVGRKQAYTNVDHRYTLILDGVSIGAMVRQGPGVYWAPPAGRPLVARERLGGIDPAALGRRGLHQRFTPDVGPKIDWRRGPKGVLKGIIDEGAFWLFDPMDPPEQRWLEQSHAMRGTWDVWNESGEPLLTLCPPGAAHTTRWAVLPQSERPVPIEAVLLAAYVVFTLW